jgi:predicted nucleotide-binding protein
VLFHADGENGIALRLAAIHAALGETPETSDFLALLRLAAARYQERGIPPRLDDTELAAAGLPRERLKYIDAFFEKNLFLTGPSGTAEVFSYEVHSGIEPYLGVVSLTGFLETYWNERFVPKDFPSANESQEVDRRRVFLAHGRNAQAARAMQDLLSAFRLEAVVFRDALAGTNKATPSIPEVLESAFASTYAAVVLLTPDDLAQLRSEFLRPSDPEHERRAMGQARPNVLFEAGMSWARHGPTRTVIVELGSLRPLTDLSGLHIVHFDGSAQARRDLGSRLEVARCPVNWTERDWLTAGDFAAVLHDLQATGGADDLHLVTPPNVVLRVGSPDIQEPWLEWLHLEAENLGRERAVGAWIQLRIPGFSRLIRLMWTGPLEKTDLEHGLPVLIPLIIRNNDARPHRVAGVELKPGEAVFTDISYLKDFASGRSFGHSGATYRTQLDLSIFYGSGSRATASFNLQIPDATGGGRMSVYRVS